MYLRHYIEVSYDKQAASFSSWCAAVKDRYTPDELPNSLDDLKVLMVRRCKLTLA